MSPVVVSARTEGAGDHPYVAFPCFDWALTWYRKWFVLSDEDVLRHIENISVLTLVSLAH